MIACGLSRTKCASPSPSGSTASTWSTLPVATAQLLGLRRARGGRGGGVGASPALRGRRLGSRALSCAAPRHVSPQPASAANAASASGAAQRIAGNSTTSRRLFAPVSSITRRSMPSPTPAGRRHPVLERPHVGLVERLRLLVAAPQLLGLLLEAAALLVGVVELGERVGDLEAADVGLPALDQALLGAVALGERRHLDRVVEDEGRLDQGRLDLLREQAVDELAPALLRARPRSPSPRRAPRGSGARARRCRSARGSRRAASPAATAARARSRRRRARPWSSRAPRSATRATSVSSRLAASS